MRQKYGRQWWWMSFFLAYVSQYIMLLGLTLPLYSANFSVSPWHWCCDGIALAVCFTGAACIYLHEYAMFGSA